MVGVLGGGMVIEDCAPMNAIPSCVRLTVFNSGSVVDLNHSFKVPAMSSQACASAFYVCLTVFTFVSVVETTQLDSDSSTIQEEYPSTCDTDPCLPPLYLCCDIRSPP